MTGCHSSSTTNFISFPTFYTHNTHNKLLRQSQRRQEIIEIKTLITRPGSCNASESPAEEAGTPRSRVRRQGSVLSEGRRTSGCSEARHNDSRVIDAKQVIRSGIFECIYMDCIVLYVS